MAAKPGSGPSGPGGTESVLHQQSMIVLGLFAGFALTSLMLLLGSPGPFHQPLGPFSGPDYFSALVTLIAVVAVVSVFGVLSSLEMAGGLAEEGSSLDLLAYGCFLTGLFGLVVFFPLLLWPVTGVGALTVLGTEVGLLVAYYVAGRKARASSRTAGTEGSG